MAVTNNLIKIIKEGQAQLQVPKTVFYNPVQEFNRDLSVLVLRTYLKSKLWNHKNQEKYISARGGMKILDALSASGLRSIRYAKELDTSSAMISKIVANDLSEVAVDLIKKNIELNNVQDKVEASHSDAARLMYLSSANFNDRFHVIDLDPFGTGAQFFNAAVSTIGEAGLLMVTCTDTAVLCGNASESCFARYGSMSIRADFCHDASLRIILKSIESHASVYGRYIKPLLSISADFYVRLFLQVYTQQAETKRSASKMSQIYLCKECKTHELNPLGTCDIRDNPKQAESNNLAVKCQFKPAVVTVGDRCKICGGKYVLAGPIWSGPIHDRHFLDLLKEELTLEKTKNDFKTFRRMEGVIHMCDEELDSPLFYSISNISSILKMKMPRTKDIMSALTNEGYKTSATHTGQTGLKTDAPSTVVWDMFCQIAEGVHQSRQEAVGNNDQEKSLYQRIMSRPTRKKNFNFSYNPAIETESQKKSLLRFHVNPEREWGPMSRPSAKKHENDGTEKITQDEVEEKSACLGEQAQEAEGIKKRKISIQDTDFTS